MNKKTNIITFDYKIIMIIILINSIMFIYSMIMMDSARDVYQAYQISHGINFPLLGPDIGGFTHVGPIWFYFLAIPALSNSLLLISIWIGFFSSLKILIAYTLGKKILNEKFALLWVSALFLPGWHIYDNLVFFHTNLVQTLTFTYLLLAYNLMYSDDDKSLKWLFLSLSLAIHAHPSTIILAIFIPIVIYQNWSKIRTRSFIYGILLFVLPFIPYIANQIINNYPDLHRILMHYNSQTSQLSIFQRLFNFILSLFYYGPLQIYQYISIWNKSLASLIFITYLLTITLSCIGLVKYILYSKLNVIKVLKYLFVFIILCLFILLLRPHITFYMVLVLTPFITGIIAFGVFQLVKKLKYKSIRAILILFFTFNLAPIIAYTSKYDENQFPIFNTTNIELSPQSIVQNNPSIDTLSVINSTRIGSFFCTNIFIHGPFAIILDYTSAAFLNFNCSSFKVRLGGIPINDENHVFLMHKSFWNKIKIKPEKWIASNVGYTHKFIHHSDSKYWDTAPFKDYNHPQRLNIKKNKINTFVYQFTAKNNSIIVVTNLLHMYIKTNIVSIIINDGNRKPLLLQKNIGNWMYKCDNCSENEVNKWEITISTEEKNVIDINELLINTEY